MAKVKSSARRIGTIMSEKYLTTEEVAEKLKISVGHFRRIWPKFTQFDCRPTRVGGSKKGKMLFKESEIEHALDQWRVA